MSPARPLALIVDDDPHFCRYLSAVLDAEGFDTEEAPSVPAALQLLRSDRTFDLASIDVMLPGESGFELCEQIRGDPSLRSLPLVMISARTHPQDRALAEDVGADAFLEKPVSVRALQEALQRLQRARPGERR